MKRSQRNNPGTANSTRHTRSQSSTNRTTSKPKTETISRFFKKIENTPASTQAAAAPTGRHNISGLSDSEFVSPPKARKVAKIFTDVKENVKRVTRSRKAKKVPIHNEEQKLMAIGKTSDVNMEHLQLAMALSKSMEPELAITNEEEGLYPSTQQITENIRQELQGFKIKSAAPSKVNQEPIRTTSNKKSKYRFVKPKLFTRTEEERTKIIQEKLSEILSHTISNSQPKGNEAVYSSELQEIKDENQRFFHLSCQETKSNAVYYVENLLFGEKSAPCGCLLRNWGSIPGREKSPLREMSNYQPNTFERTHEVPDDMNIINYIDNNESLHVKQSKTNKNIRKSSINLETGLQSPERKELNITKIKLSNLQENIVSENVQYLEEVEDTNKNEEAEKRNNIIGVAMDTEVSACAIANKGTNATLIKQNIVCVSLVTHSGIGAIENKQTIQTKQNVDDVLMVTRDNEKETLPSRTQILNKTLQNSKSSINSNEVTNNNKQKTFLTNNSCSNNSTTSQKSKKTVRSESPDLFASSDEEISDDEVFFTAKTPPMNIEYPNIENIDKKSLNCSSILLKDDARDIVSGQLWNNVKENNHKTDIETRENENIIENCENQNDKSNNMELNTENEVNKKHDKDEFDNSNQSLLDDNCICSYESFVDFDEQRDLDDTEKTIESDDNINVNLINNLLQSDGQDDGNNDKSNENVSPSENINEIISHSHNNDDNDSLSTEDNNVTHHVHTLLNSVSFANKYKSICVDKYLSSPKLNTTTSPHVEIAEDIDNFSSHKEKQNGGDIEEDFIDLSQNNIDANDDCIDLSQDSDDDYKNISANRTKHSFQRHLSSKSIDSTASTNESICISDEELNYSCLHATPKPARLSWKYEKLALKKNKFAISDSEDDTSQEGETSLGRNESEINVTKLLEAICDKNVTERLRTSRNTEKSRILERSVVIDSDDDQFDVDLQKALELSQIEDSNKICNQQTRIDNGNVNIEFYDKEDDLNDSNITSVSMKLYQDKAESNIKQNHTIQKQNTDNTNDDEIESMDIETNEDVLSISNEQFASVSMVIPNKAHFNKETKEQEMLNDDFPSCSFDINHKNKSHTNKVFDKSIETENNIAVNSSRTNITRVSHMERGKVNNNKPVHTEAELTMFNDSFPSFSDEIHRKNLGNKNTLNKSEYTVDVNIFKEGNNVLVESKGNLLTNVRPDKVSSTKEANDQTMFNDTFPSFSHEISFKNTSLEQTQANVLRINENVDNSLKIDNVDVVSSKAKNSNVSKMGKDQGNKNKEINLIAREHTMLNDSFPSFSNDKHQINIEDKNVENNDKTKFDDSFSSFSHQNISDKEEKSPKTKDIETSETTIEENHAQLDFNNSFPSFDHDNFNYCGDYGYISSPISQKDTTSALPTKSLVTSQEKSEELDEFDMLVNTKSVFDIKKPQCRRVQELINKTTSKKQNEAYITINKRASCTFEDTFANLLNQTNVLKTLDTINNTQTTSELENLASEKTPPCSKTPETKASGASITRSTDTPGTPLDGLYVKTSNVTPMPLYEQMTTPEIHAELDKIGVKCMKRRRGVQMLKHVYNSMHLHLQGDIEVDDVKQPNKRRKKLNYDSQESTEAIEDNLENHAASCATNIEINHKLAESEPLEHLIFERKQSKRIKSCQLPFHIAWHNFLCVNRDIWENVLLYEPLQVEVLYAMFKDLGFKYHIQDMITFFDRKCITIRIKQNN